MNVLPDVNNTWANLRPTHRAIPEWLSDARTAESSIRNELECWVERHGASNDKAQDLQAAWKASWEWLQDLEEHHARGTVPFSILTDYPENRHFARVDFAEQLRHGG